MRHRRGTMAFSGGDPGRHGRPVHQGPEGLHPVRGHGDDPGHHRGGRGDELRRDGDPPAAGDGHPPEGPERRGVHVVGGRREPGAALDPADAAREPQARRRRGDPRAAAQALPGAGDAGLPPEPADPPHRRALVQGALPVHAPEPRHRRAVRERDDARGPPAGGRRHPERDERPADQEPAAARRDRPRPRRRARRQHGRARERALQRLRHPPGLHHPDAEQPVLRDHGGAAAVPAGPDGAQHAVHPLGHRRPGPGAARRDGEGDADRSGRSASTTRGSSPRSPSRSTRGRASR